MGAYEDVRSDVLQTYARLQGQAPADVTEEALPRAESLTEGMATPAVTVSGSQPAWLGAGWRQALFCAALTGAGAGLVLTALLGADTVSAGFTGGFAIVALVIAYLTVAGFGRASFSVGSGPSGSTDESRTDVTPRTRQQVASRPGG